MVQVPTTPGRSIQVQEEPGARFRYAESRNYFGQAAEQAGRALAQTAETWNEVQATYDEAEVKKRANETASALRESLWTGEDAYLLKKGLDAEAAKPGLEERFASLRESALADVKNERQREMLIPVLDKQFGDAMVDVVKHAEGQASVELQKQTEARLAGFQEDAVRGFSDTERYAENIAGGLLELEGIATRQGWSEERLDDAEERFISGVHTATITGRLAADDIDGAMDLLDKHRDGMTFGDVQSIETKLQPAIQYRQAENDALGALSNVPAPAPGDGSITFAVPLGGKGKTVSGGEYGSARSYGGHSGQDYAAPAGTPVNPTAPGKVRFAGKIGGYGNRVEIDHGGGYVTTYSHLADIKVKKGDTVDGSTLLGGVGNTGDSHGDHLHYEMLQNETKIKPFAAERSTKSAAREWDLSTAYAALEETAEKEGWTPERLERARQRVDERVKRDEMLNSRREDEEWDAALGTVDRLGDSFTDVSQIPNFEKLPPDRRVQLRNMADAGKRAADGGESVKANGDIAMALEIMAIEKPEEFLRVDLREYRGMVTPAEFASLQTKAATIRAKPQEEIAFRGAINGTITSFATKEMDLDGKPNAERKVRVVGIMENWLRGHVKPGVQPTQAQLLEALRFATGSVSRPAGGLKGALGFGDTKVRRTDLPVYQIPPDVRRAIMRAWTAETGRAPTDQQIVDYYNSNKVGFQ